MHAKPQLVNVAKWLEENGYEKGYGTFWNSNSVTFLTNGKLICGVYMVLIVLNLTSGCRRLLIMKNQRGQNFCTYWTKR